jgi:hypothetical protein
LRVGRGHGHEQDHHGGRVYQSTKHFPSSRFKRAPCAPYPLDGLRLVPLRRPDRRVFGLARAFGCSIEQ